VGEQRRSEAFPVQTVVIGGGAVGLLYAARLVLGGNSAMVVTRSSHQAEQITRHGITFHHLDGSLDTIPIAARPVEQGLPEGSLYLLTVKQTDLLGLLPTLQQIPAHAPIIAMQNGMGHQELLSEVLPKSQCFFGINAEGAKRLSGTEVAHTGRGSLRVGPWERGQEQDPVVRSFINWAEANGILARYEESIQPFAWRKLVANALINPLTAIFEVPNGALLENPHTLGLMRELFVEATTVANHYGQKLGETDWQEMISICRNTSRNLSSMLQDVRRKRQTEVEAINGYLVKKGKEAGIPTPLHESLLRVILLKTSMGREKVGGDST
jgi:2-dehydropantoate 2-reductase